MNKCSSSIVIAFGKTAILELVGGALSLSEKVDLVSFGCEASARGVSEVYLTTGGDCPVVGYVEPLVQLIREKKPELVLVEQCRNGRLIAGILAAKLGVGVQTDITEAAFDGDGFITRRVVYGGLAVKTERSGKLAVMCVGAGVFLPAAEAANGEKLCIAAQGSEGISVIDRKERVQQKTNLAAARRVVGVGRGVDSPETLALVEQLASVIEAELGCTRPVAEEDRLMPSSRYIGVSGVTVSPELYIAVGLSGQVQHTAGISKARYVIAVNKDEHAPIFSDCDLGVVGDLKTIIPQITAALSENKA